MQLALRLVTQESAPRGQRTQEDEAKESLSGEVRGTRAADFHQLNVFANNCYLKEDKNVCSAQDKEDGGDGRENEK